jgi:hypothetical protein
VLAYCRLWLLLLPGAQLNRSNIDSKNSRNFDINNNNNNNNNVVSDLRDNLSSQESI